MRTNIQSTLSSCPETSSSDTQEHQDEVNNEDSNSNYVFTLPQVGRSQSLNCMPTRLERINTPGRSVSERGFGKNMTQENNLGLNQLSLSSMSSVDIHHHDHVEGLQTESSAANQTTTERDTIPAITDTTCTTPPHLPRQRRQRRRRQDVSSKSSEFRNHLHELPDNTRIQSETANPRHASLPETSELQHNNGRSNTRSMASVHPLPVLSNEVLDSTDGVDEGDLIVAIRSSTLQQDSSSSSRRQNQLGQNSGTHPQRFQGVKSEMLQSRQTQQSEDCIGCATSTTYSLGSPPQRRTSPPRDTRPSLNIIPDEFDSNESEPETSQQLGRRSLSAPPRVILQDLVDPQDFEESISNLREPPSRPPLPSEARPGAFQARGRAFGDYPRWAPLFHRPATFLRQFSARLAPQSHTVVEATLVNEDRECECECECDCECGTQDATPDVVEPDRIVTEESIRSEMLKFWTYTSLIGLTSIAVILGFALALSKVWKNKNIVVLEQVSVFPTNETLSKEYICNFFATRENSRPRPFEQCLCNGHLDTVPIDVLTAYQDYSDQLIKYGVMQAIPRFDDCSDPRNSIMYWLIESVTGQSYQLEIVERYVLGVIFMSLGGFGWTNSSLWLTQAPVCKWNGVNCDGSSDNVTALQLQNLGLFGTIPMEVANLTELQAINISDNRGIAGTIPSELTRLGELKTLDVRDTSMATNLFNSQGTLLDTICEASPVDLTIWVDYGINCTCCDN